VAHLGLGRAHSLEGNTILEGKIIKANARAAYHVWKDAFETD
jgi:hypothetical protein